MPEELGDILLFALSAARSWSWHAFKNAFDEVSTRKARGSGAVIEEPDRHQRRNTLTTMDALGHCDVAFGVDGSDVFVAPPVLAALPSAGLPRAVLCGMRSPETIPALRAAATSEVAVRVLSQGAKSILVPSRIEVQCESNSTMRQFADAVGVPYMANPPAWSVSLFSGSLDSYLESLNWSERPDLTWPRADFNPDRLHFVSERADDAPLVLSRYQDPIRGRFLFRLWSGVTSADVDVSWGRYAVLHSQSRQVLDYEQHGFVSVPRTVPLPRLIARALTLCSGYAPSTRTALGGASRDFDVYRAVPPDVYRVCASKLGQSEPANVV